MVNKTLRESPKGYRTVEMKGKICYSNLIGSEPKITPLVLSAAIALSACKNGAKKIFKQPEKIKAQIYGNDC